MMLMISFACPLSQVPYTGYDERRSVIHFVSSLNHADPLHGSTHQRARARFPHHPLALKSVL
jgi:hypothetical protein